MMGKLGLIDVEPNSVYMNGATGPFAGAQLLFTGQLAGPLSRHELEHNLDLLDGHLNLPFGMQILEDALCNWQKSPAAYVYFSG
jgi:hypothetical protein